LPYLQNQKKTNLERYGTENINALQSKKEKTKETCKKKYGVENPFQTEKAKEISKEWASSKEFSEKLKENWKTKTKEDIAKRYEKSKQTNLKKHGIENLFWIKKKLKGFSIAQIAPKVSVFRSTLAKNLIEKYLGNVNLIIDPFSGFSGRMLGAFNSNKKYIGFDINEEHVKESNEIVAYKSIQDFCKVEVQDLTTFEGEDWQNQNAALFTCPPYKDKESWNEDEVEKSCDEWIDLCLQKHKGCKRYLFVVDETEKYKDKIVEVLANKFHFGTNFEYVVLL